MTTVNIYLTFNGNCLEAFKFYAAAFQKELTEINTFAEIPPQTGMPEISDAEKKLIMHTALPISSETRLMGSDTASWSDKVSFGNNFSVSIQLINRTEANRLFAALSHGGKVTMPLADTFWNAYFGMFTDKFGVQWMINCES